MGKQGWVEWALVTAFLALAAAGAVAVFGDQIREALGVRPATRAPAARAPATGAPASAPRAPAR
jgi:cytochrome c oxidase subunit IV